MPRRQDRVFRIRRFQSSVTSTSSMPVTQTVIWWDLSRCGQWRGAGPDGCAPQARFFVRDPPFFSTASRSSRECAAGTGPCMPSRGFPSPAPGPSPPGVASTGRQEPPRLREVPHDRHGAGRALPSHPLRRWSAVFRRPAPSPLAAREGRTVPLRVSEPPPRLVGLHLHNGWCPPPYRRP